MHLQVSVSGGASDGLEISFEQFPITLGREGNPRLPVQDRWASRHHCELFEQDGRIGLRDLGSKHGTFVNGDCVEQCMLNEGDKLMVGLTIISVDKISNAAPVEENLLIDRESGVSA